MSSSVQIWQRCSISGSSTKCKVSVLWVCNSVSYKEVILTWQLYLFRYSNKRCKIAHAKFYSIFIVCFIKAAFIRQCLERKTRHQNNENRVFWILSFKEKPWKQCQGHVNSKKEHPDKNGDHCHVLKIMKLHMWSQNHSKQARKDTLWLMLDSSAIMLPRMKEHYHNIINSQ